MSRSLSKRSETRLSNLENLIRDIPVKSGVTAVVKDEVLRISGTAAWDCFNGKRSDAPLLWVTAPKAGSSFQVDRGERGSDWTAWVKCRFMEASDNAAALFTVYDGPDGSGHLGFSFGPRTLGGRGVGYQPTDLEEWAATGDDPFIWHELRMRRYGNTEDNSSLFDLAYRACDDRYADDALDMEDPAEAEGTTVAEAVRPFRNVTGSRIALGLRHAQSGKSQVVFKDLRIHKGGDWPGAESDFDPDAKARM